MQSLLKEIIAGCLGILIGILIGGYRMGHKYAIKLMNFRQWADKYLNLVRLYDIWLMTKQKGMRIETYLSDRNIRTIAIYGMSYLGIRLFYELKNSSVHVQYGIDREPGMGVPGLIIYRPNNLPVKKVDAVIVTAMLSFDSIKKDMEKLGFEKVIAFDEILYDLV